MKILDIGSKDEIPSFASRVNPHAPKLKILLDYVLIMYLEGGNAIRINPQALFDFEGLCQIQAKYSVFVMFSKNVGLVVVPCAVST